MVILAQDIKEVAGGHVDCERAVLKGSAQSRVQILERLFSGLPVSLPWLPSYWIMMSLVKFTDPFWSRWTKTFL